MYLFIDIKGDSKILDLNTIIQIGVVVEDINEAADMYADFFGVDRPKINITDTYDKTGANYKGKPTEGRAKIANFKFDKIYIELIEPDDQPSTWREFLDNKGEGIHHIGFLVKNTHGIIRGLKDKGVDVIQRGKFSRGNGGQYTYLETLNNLKFIIQLLQMN